MYAEEVWWCFGSSSDPRQGEGKAEADEARLARLFAPSIDVNRASQPQSSVLRSKLSSLVEEVSLIFTIEFGGLYAGNVRLSPQHGIHSHDPGRLKTSAVLGLIDLELVAIAKSQRVQEHVVSLRSSRDPRRGALHLNLRPLSHELS